MPPEARRWLLQFLQDLRNEARERAAESLRRHKAPLYLYWKVVQVWCGHLAKVLRTEAAGTSRSNCSEAVDPQALKGERTFQSTPPVASSASNEAGAEAALA